MENNYSQEYESAISFTLKDTLEKIENGDKSTKNYYTVFQLYESIQKKNEYKKEIDKYAKLIFDSASDAVNNYNKLPDSEKDEDVNKNIAEEYYYLAVVFEYYKNKKQKLYCINKAIELNSSNVDYYFLRGQYYEEENKYKKAEADYKKVIKIGDEKSVRDAKLKISFQNNFRQLDTSAKDILLFVIYVLLFIYYLFVKLS